MNIAIMQPYILPYIGYFQLIGAVERFVIYDNIKYTKKGWINRNRISVHGREGLFSLPLRSASDSADIIERQVADNYRPKDLLNQFRGSYSKSPYFSEVFPTLEEIFEYRSTNLFDFLQHSLVAMLKLLDIPTELLASSSIPANHHLKGQARVIDVCKHLRGTTYINPVGGAELYSREEFNRHNIELQFLVSDPIMYSQGSHEFIPSLSIVDVLMFNSLEETKKLISCRYQLVQHV